MIDGIDSEQVWIQIHQKAAAVIKIHHSLMQDGDIAFFAKGIKILDGAMMDIGSVIPLIGQCTGLRHIALADQF